MSYSLKSCKTNDIADGYFLIFFDLCTIVTYSSITELQGDDNFGINLDLTSLILSSILGRFASARRFLIFVVLYAYIADLTAW